MPKRFCNYTLIREINRGATGIVYLAKDARGRDVALKTLTPLLIDDPEERRRFMVETSRQPRHPHIVRILDSGECERVPYIAMELVDGPSLNDMILQAKRNGTRVSLTDMDEILADVAVALDSAHKDGLVHCDIKPGNILVRRSDRHAYLTDFGSARRWSGGKVSVVRTGMIGGTVDYVSPEQIRGHTAKPSADIYSLGVTVYHALAGRLPFEADDELVMAHKQLMEKPPDLRTFNPNIPPAVAAVVMRTLEKDPNQRYPTAVAFAHAFHQAVAPGGASHQNWPILAAIGGVAVLIVVALGLAVAGLASTARPTEPPVAEPSVTAASNRRVSATATILAGQPTAPDAAAETPPAGSSSETQPAAGATATLSSDSATQVPASPGALTGFALQAAPLSIQRWGKPRSANGCDNPDDQTPVLRYEVVMTIQNTGNAPLSNWRMDYYSSRQVLQHKCIVTGQEGAEIAPNSSMMVKTDIYIEDGSLTRVDFITPVSKTKLCVTGKSLLPCS